MYASFGIERKNLISNMLHVLMIVASTIIYYMCPNASVVHASGSGQL